MGSSGPAGNQYLSPSEIAFSPDGHWIYVVCERSDELLIINATTQLVEARVVVGHVPRDLAVSEDGRWIYVSNSWTDEIDVIDSASREIVRKLGAGFEPTGLALDHKANTLYVANRISNDISVIDLSSGREAKRLVAGHGSSYLAASGGKVFGTHVYPRIGQYRTLPESEITVIDTERQTVEQRIPLPNVAGARGTRRGLRQFTHGVWRRRWRKRAGSA
jgi:YVTN family beta-propeller protein